MLAMLVAEDRGNSLGNHGMTDPQIEGVGNVHQHAGAQEGPGSPACRA